MSSNNSSHIIRILGSNFDFVRDNWTDDLSAEYIRFVQEIGSNMMKVEHNRPRYITQIEKILNECCMIEEDLSDGSQYVKVRKR